MTIGLGILSWKGGDTLKASLESYALENLLSIFDENVIFLPEQRDYETQIAQDFNLKIFGSNANLGILGGFKALAMSMTADYVLLLENDCPLIENFSEAKRQITLAQSLLDTNQAHIVRLRHRYHAGQDWSVVRKYREYYPAPDAPLYIKTYCFFKRFLRPHKAERLKGWSLYTPQSHHQSLFPDAVYYNKADDYYITDSRYLPWTNQSILIKRDFFLSMIIAYAESAGTKRRINGFRNLEIEMNSDFWRKGQFKIAIPKGAIYPPTHRRKRVFFLRVQL
jgi:hypothetical protein